MKHNFELTEEEKVLEAAVKRDDLRLVTKEERAYLRQVAENTSAKNKTITIRLSERNLVRLKAAALREGVPYQTFVSALIQKHTG